MSKRVITAVFYGVEDDTGLTVGDQCKNGTIARIDEAMEAGHMSGITIYRIYDESDEMMFEVRNPVLVIWDTPPPA